MKQCFENLFFHESAIAKCFREKQHCTSCPIQQCTETKHKQAHMIMALLTSTEAHRRTSPKQCFQTIPNSMMRRTPKSNTNMQRNYNIPNLIDQPFTSSRISERTNCKTRLPLIQGFMQETQIDSNTLVNSFPFISL